MEEESGGLLRAALPSEWVIHEYKPDYGIDGTIEIFEPVSEGGDVYETLGEHIFFQLKSINRTTLSLRIARSYGSPLAGGKRQGPQLSVEYEAVSYDLEVSELLTVEAMGASFAVVLFLVTLDTRTTYMISLTDYIERVLDREDPDWRTRTKKRIFIPSALTVPGRPSAELLRLYGGRSKLMHLFNVASYQFDELERVFGDREMRPLAARFCERLLALDVWRISSWILPVHYVHQLHACRELLAGNLAVLPRLGAVISVEELGKMGILEETIDHLLLNVWRGLRALGATFEERVREWGMPTHLGITDAGL
ncbi:DUF4365 domain-containing protein [Nonomuraea sp. NPDC050478]|uniref:DUF4365 domain-containing protein n=1 Tax=Nonomuraea sp. NPDC050478 TaxID=3364365 RepID=UPI00378DE2D1